ncbi:MAG TPA: hypothetical protein VMU62_02440 [Acidobacteriaceae bacterium]|nr:hypothetical protein [Acidobacteriaceae bacterium]
MRLDGAMFGTERRATADLTGAKRTNATDFGMSWPHVNGLYRPIAFAMALFEIPSEPAYPMEADEFVLWCGTFREETGSAGREK